MQDKADNDGGDDYDELKVLCSYATAHPGTGLLYSSEMTLRFVSPVLA
jgi:hypothetical protein